MADPLLKAINRCNPNEPLKPGDERFVNLDEVRGVVVQQRVRRFIDAAKADGLYAHIAFAGHRGSGKSTELQRVIGDLNSQGFVTLAANATSEIDSKEVAFSDVLRLMASQLVGYFEELAKDGDVKTAFDNVEGWFMEIANIDATEVERTLHLGGEASLGGATPLARVLATIGLQRKSRTQEREEVRRKLEQYPSGLLDNLNILLDAIRRAGGARDIIFVLDNVDRYSPELVNEVFLRNSELFTGIQAHLLFTVPISLLYSPVEDRVQDRYRSVTLPMIPVFRDRSRDLRDDVVDLVEGAVYKRAPGELFASREVPRELIRQSGGCWRDLLRLLEEALLDTDSVVTEEHAARAVNVLRSEYERSTTHDQFALLARAYLDKQIDSGKESLILLFRRAVLEYNGTRWVDVHPLLEGSREFQEALSKEKESREANAD